MSVYIYTHAYVYVSTRIWMHLTHMINHIHDMYIHVCQVLCKAHGKIPMPGIWPDRIPAIYQSQRWPVLNTPMPIQIQAPKEPSDSIKNHWMLRGTPWETYGPMFFPSNFEGCPPNVQIFPFQVWQRIRSSAVQIQLGQYTAPPSAKVRKSHLPSAVGHLDVSGRFDWAEAFLKSSAMGADKTIHKTIHKSPTGSWLCMLYHAVSTSDELIRFN